MTILSLPFVRLLQLLGVVDLGHAHPAAAVVGLHEHRIAEALPDVLLEVEEAGVALERDLQVGLALVGLGGDEHRVRYRHPEPHHRAVRRVLLVGLHRPRVVEDVDAVHDDGLLDPLAARAEPMRQPVDHEVVLHGLAQVEGLDRHALDVERDRVLADGDREIEGPGRSPRSRWASRCRRPRRARYGVFVCSRREG